MNKIGLIISREYFTRVTKKSFIIVTLLTPILMAALIMVPVIIALNSEKEVKVFVTDENDYFINKFADSKKVHFMYPNGDVEMLKQQCIAGECDAVLQILGGSQSNQANLYFYEEPPMSLKGNIQEQMDKINFDKTLIDTFRVDLKKYEQIKLTSQTSIAALQIDEMGKAQASSMELNRIIGIICGIMICTFVFMYASQVLRSVLEEKTNRIIEVIVSSVKPFQFMMGKIIGVALVGITQFALQVGAIFIILIAVQAFIPRTMLQSEMVPTEIVNNMSDNAFNVNVASNIPQTNSIFNDISTFYNFPFSTMIICFLFYFIFGYLVYASLFAGIGSAVDNETDSQQFILPVTIPLYLPLVLISSMANAPQNGIIWWLSMIPLTSPVAMIFRIPSGVPLWELITSMFLLVAFFVFCVWASAKIYRTGILMYGKKITWRELWKWIRY